MTDLTKAIELAEKASEQLQKSHVKQYTRTTASGASVQVKEHDDKRQAAEKDVTKEMYEAARKKAESASAAADKSGKYENHTYAAKAHRMAEEKALDRLDARYHSQAAIEHDHKAKVAKAAEEYETIPS
jgi:hypothetical protein